MGGIRGGIGRGKADFFFSSSRFWRSFSSLSVSNGGLGLVILGAGDSVTGAPPISTSGESGEPDTVGVIVAFSAGKIPRSLSR